MRAGMMVALVVCAFVAGERAAHAEEADYTVFVGTARGAWSGASFAPAEAEPMCVGCRARQDDMLMRETPGTSSLATVAVGMAGTRGRARGGGEVFSLLDVGGRADGYTALVTYAGVDLGRAFTQAGLGVGTFWGGQQLGTLSALAGNAHAELGLRITEHWVVLTRADVIVNDTSTGAVGSLGLQLIP